MKAYAAECAELPFVDHCVIGEYELPVMDIVEELGNANKLCGYQFVPDINKLPNGDNFMPYRDDSKLDNYYEPTMATARVQLQVAASRGCPFKCTYCQWPKTLNGGKYRSRSPEMVIDELKTMKNRLGNNLRSILFDDDTWNIGNARVKEMCKGLKELGIPWTMMGRIDTSQLDVYDHMVDAGCVGMRFGIETFNQRLLDNAKKSLNATTIYNNIAYLLKRFKNMEFHFTTMKNLPGSLPSDWENDKIILQDLIAQGAENGHRVHYQNSDCIPFPGTELWEELVEMGNADKLKDFRMYDGGPSNDAILAKTIGFLGTDYKPKVSKYSGTGTPTNLPTD